MSGESASRFDLDVKIRRAGTADLDLIFHSWISCMKNQAPWKELEPNWFAAAAHGLVGRLLEISTVLVAAQPEDRDQIFGYIVADVADRTLHWVYTKHPFRRAGVARRLMLAAFEGFDEPIRYTHSTHSIRHHRERWNLERATPLLCTKTRSK